MQWHTPLFLLDLCSDGVAGEGVREGRGVENQGSRRVDKNIIGIMGDSLEEEEEEGYRR